MSMTYVELHCHSSYSFLDGASLPEELAARAAELGYPALALTDHDGVYGSLEFAHAAKALGVRPITGAEVTLTGGSHVTLLVETSRGYANLCRILTEAHAGTRREGREDREPLAPSVGRRVRRGARGRPRLPLRLRPGRASPCATRMRPPRLAACVRPRALPRRAAAPVRARRRPPQRRSCAISPSISASRRSPPATCTPTQPRRTLLQDTLVAIRCRTSLDGCEQERRGNRESILRAPAEVADRFAGIDPAAAARTVEIAERLEFDLTAGARLPLPRLLGRRGAGDPAARGDLQRRLRRPLPPKRPEAATRRARARLEKRARARSTSSGSPGFFLLHWEVLELARECALQVRGRDSPRRFLPPGRGRGSSVGSIVCYLTGPLARRSRSRTSSRSGASSTASSPRSRTSTSTSRATSARS